MTAPLERSQSRLLSLATMIVVVGVLYFARSFDTAGDGHPR